MKNKKQCILALLLSLCSITSYAYDFEVDGLYYNVLSLTDGTVELTHSGVNTETLSPYNRYYVYRCNYDQAVKIPKEIVYKGRTFTVAGIGANSFFGHSEIRSLSLPASIRYIANAITSGGSSYGYPFYRCSVLTDLSIGNMIPIKSLFSTYKDKYTNDKLYENITQIALSKDFTDSISASFEEFSKLTELKCFAPTPPKMSIESFSNSQILNMQVYVPEEYYEAYQNADGWKDFWELHLMKSVKGIALNMEKVEIGPNESFQLLASILPEDAFNKNVTWTSDNPEVAEVDSTGRVTGMGKGDAIITAKTTDGTDLSATCLIHVDRLVNSIKLDLKSLTLEPSQIMPLTATILPKDAFVKDVTWKSENENVAVVDAKGYVTGIGQGETDIIATTTDGSDLSATCHVRVNLLVKSIALDTKELTLEQSQTSQLSVMISPKEAFVKDVTWKSQNENVATVDEQGRVTAVGKGNTNIIVTTTDGSNLTDTCKVSVTYTTAANGLYFKIGSSTAVLTADPNGTEYKGAIEIPEKVYIKDVGWFKVTGIDANAFADATGLTKIAIPASITSIGSDAFAGCSALEFVGVENGSTLLANFDDVFADSDIKELYLGSDSVTFNEKSKLLGGLRSIVLGNSITTLPDSTVCNESLERFVVEDGSSKIFEPTEYCAEKSWGLTSIKTLKDHDRKIYQQYNFTVNIMHLNPLYNLLANKTLRFVYFGREVDKTDVYPSINVIEKETADEDYKYWGFKDEYRYLYNHYIARTNYQKDSLVSISMNTQNAILEIGDSLQLGVISNPTTVPPTNVIRWSSSNEDVATVDVFGKVTMVGKGKATITAQTLDGTNFCATCVIADEATGIDNAVTAKRCNASYTVYNLSGIKVMSTTNKSDLNTLPKGIYIVNGKKVMVD